MTTIIKLTEESFIDLESIRMAYVDNKATEYARETVVRVWFNDGTNALYYGNTAKALLKALTAVALDY